MSAAGARLLLSGYYGFDNFGDEAILQIFVSEWRRRRSADLLRVLSGSPTQTQRLGVEAVPRTSVARIADLLRHTDVFVSGGGGLLQSSTSLRSLLYYAGLIHEAKSCGAAAVIFAQGIGPLSLMGKQIVKHSCGGVDLAIVRDEASAQLMCQLVPRTDVRVAADPVFLAPDAVPEDKERALADEGIIGTGDLVAVVVRPSRVLEKISGEIARVVDVLASRCGAQVIFVPFQRTTDVEAAVSIIRRCRTAPVLVGGGYDLATMTALFKRCTAVVGMRLHALILAARLGVPFLAVPYDPKIVALCQSLRYPLAPLQAGTADELTESLWAKRGALSAHLHDAAQTQAAMASKAFDWLQELVERAAEKTP
ncbi:MAG TPA: polysaccharide pyruvyl transferase CsaB [Candidatus Eremiobacteraceae bacterium]|nr:polysaccharide pyruvyl transferase CsaB [Candidatus Eremiobacteraceae bacterium]